MFSGATAMPVATAIGWITVYLGVLVFFGILFFGLGCLLFDWCPLTHYLTGGAH
jgi:hypothetical protein